MTYVFHVLVYLEIYALLALALNLVVGYGGLLTLAHAGYFAVGAYTYALLSVTLHGNLILSLVAGAVIGAVLSLAMSLSSWRLRDDFFVLMTLAVGTLLYSGLNNWFSVQAPIGSWQNLTNGPFGISAIPSPTLLGWSVKSEKEMAIISGLVVGLLALFTRRLMKSPWGRLVECMRDDEVATRSLGKRTRLLRVQLFGISCAITAVAGGLYAAHVRYVDPSVASLNEAILILSMVVIGGTGNTWGAVAGAISLTAIPELLRFLTLPDTIAANIRLLVFGAALVVFMHVRPQGIAGRYRLE